MGFDGHVAGWLLQVGPLASGGMAAAPVSWSEISAWAAMTGHRPTPWEADTLMIMSRAYLAQVQDCNGEAVPAPYARVEVDKAQVSQDLGKLLDGIIADQAKGGR